MNTLLRLIIFVPKVALCAGLLAAMMLLEAFYQMEEKRP